MKIPIISDLVNKALAPIGIRPFSGGPYPDAGLGGKAMDAISGPLPGMGDLGALSMLPQIYAQMAAMNGLPNPFAGMMGQGQPQPGPTTQQPQQGPAPMRYGMVGGLMRPMPGRTSPQGQMQPAATNREPGLAPQPQAQQPMQQDFDPYALSPVSNRELNRRTSQIAAAKKQALGRIRARLSARGFGDSGALTAADAYLTSQYGNQAQGVETEMRADEFNRRNALMAAFADAAMNLYSAQRQRALDKAGVFQQQAGAAEQRTNAAHEDLFTTIALLSGGRTPGQIFGSGTPKSTPGINPNGGIYGPPGPTEFFPDNQPQWFKDWLKKNTGPQPL